MEGLDTTNLWAALSSAGKSVIPVAAAMIGFIDIQPISWERMDKSKRRISGQGAAIEEP